MKKYMFFMLAILLCFSCDDRDDNVNEVNIRIRNVSDLVYDMVQVGEPDKVHENVSPDSFSDYLQYDEAYRYAYIEIHSGEETYVLQPFDFVGEDALPIGLYTYELDVTTEGEVLLEFVVD